RRHAGRRPALRAAAPRSAPPGVQGRGEGLPDRSGRAAGHRRRVRRGGRVHPQAPEPRRVKRIGVVGAMVWDTIYGRDPAQPAVEEWGGIAYALAALDAALEDGWEIVPLIKVGRDMAAPAERFLRSL